MMWKGLRSIFNLFLLFGILTFIESLAQHGCVLLPLSPTRYIKETLNGDIFVSNFDFAGVSRFDSVFNFKWHKHILRDLAGGYPPIIVYTADNKIVIGGTRASGNIYISVLDSNFNLITTFNINTGGNDFLRDLVPTSDSGFLVVGLTSGLGAGYEDVFVAKINKNYTLEWSKALGGGSRDYGYSAYQTDDGGFLVAGCTQSFGAGMNDGYIIKLDNTGNILWSVAIGGPGLECFMDILEAPDGSIYALGYTSSFGAGNYDIYLVKLDGNGNLLWTKTYGGSSTDRGFGIKLLSDGNLLIGAETQSFALCSTDVYLIKVDPDGNVLWERTYGVKGKTQCYGVHFTDALELQNKDLLILTSVSYGTVYLMNLFKTDSMGRINITDTACFCYINDSVSGSVNSGGNFAQPNTLDTIGGTIVSDTDSVASTTFNMEFCGLCDVKVNIDTSSLPVLTANISSISNNYSCLWSTGDTTCSITVQSSGTYWVTVSDDRGCWASDTVYISSISGIILNPTPKSERCEISGWNTLNPTLKCKENIESITIFTLDGRKISEIALQGTSQTVSLSFTKDISNLPVFLYIRTQKSYTSLFIR